MTAGAVPGVRRPTWVWFSVMGLFAAVAGAGVFAYVHQYTEGLVVTGLRNIGPMGGATWGLYVAFEVYFIGVSFAGISIAAVIRLFDLRALRPLARMAEVLTVVSLVLGGLSIIADIGQPVRGIVNLFRYARPQSPFFGTFTLVIAGYLFASVVYLWLTSRRDAAVLARTGSRLAWLHRVVAAGYTDSEAERERHRRSTFWLAIFMLPLLVIAHSTLGYVFGIQVGRPGWYSALQAPAFVVLAGVSGIGVLIVLAAVVRRSLGEDETRLTIEVFGWLGRALMTLLLVYAYFVVTELLTVSYAGSNREVDVSRAMLWGRYAWIFWGSMALLALPLASMLYQAITRRWRVGWLVAGGLAVQIAAIGKRYLITVPSQTHGAMLPYGAGSYTPTWVEYAVVAGLVALGALVIGLFMKVAPIVELEAPDA